MGKINRQGFKGVYLVTGPCPHHDLAIVVDQAVKAGVCCVQLREKEADTRQFLARALALKALLAGTDIPLLINDRIDIALAAEADGIHIGQSDMPYSMARQLMGKDAIIGISVESFKDVEAAQDMDVDYIGVSPIFPTPTKTDTKKPWGLKGLEKIRFFSCHPLVAIGGLNPDNARDVIRAGADAVAVVSAICSAKDPFAATQALNAHFKHSKTTP